MEYTFAQYQESAQALRDRLGAFRPRCLLILGSGLGSLGNEVESPIAVPYEDVPPMKRSTAPAHAGRLLFGRLAGGGKVVFDIRTDAGGEEEVFEIAADDYNDQKPSRLSEDGPEGEA